MLLTFATAFYFYLRIFLADKSKLIYGLCGLAFVITGLIEAVWGLMQLYGFAPSQHGLFKITGSFFNPGPYSGWLAMVFPMALGYLIFNRNFFNRKGAEVAQSILQLAAYLLRVVTVLSMLLILPAAMSRASWLAALGGGIFVGIMYFVSVSGKRIFMFKSYFKKYGKKIIVLSAVVVVLLTVSLVGLFFLKKDSAMGRVFTWKIAAQTIMEHPMGVGLGNFGGNYGNVQSEYFASGAGNEREEYVAGGVEYAFNEYLQICVETGIIPFLIFLAFVGYVLYSGIKNKNYLPTGSLISLLIFASMSYPFNVLPFVIAFVFLSALCMADNNDASHPKTYPKYVIWTFLLTVPISVALLSSDRFQLYNAYKQWNSAGMLHNMNMHKEAVEEYSKQYPYLQDEKRFLFDYAQSLSKSEQYSKSNEILKRAIQISCDPMLHNIMGKNHQALKEYELAEQSFKRAINLVPNRLYPHYLLAKLYHEMGLKDKAESEINIVLTKPPKVESMAVEEMREELVKLKDND
jgi:tetratricopeptide (TPR) repeat protein